MKLIAIILFSLLDKGLFSAQTIPHNAPGTGNPVIPGYFADPTVKKFGDRYFIYATTDGTGWGTGPSQVWHSKDFVNWTIADMNWPTTEVYWAPDVWKHKDGKYYLFYSQPVQLHGGVSETPFGPWKELTKDGSPIVPNRMVPMAITLDGQSFLDDDGSRYMYWGTWGIYKDHGCAWGKMNDDMMTFSETSLIPNTDAKDFFEAPFVFKRDSVYYFTYSSGSCHDETYRVQYATSSSPVGPFVYADNNPLLSTNEDRSVHGPGHHSILEENDKYYIVYHRHDNPHSSNGFHRQIAADVLEFEADGKIKQVNPTHEGIGYLAPSTNPFQNELSKASFSASSEYSEHFKASYAIDDNYGTLWMPDPHDPEPFITVDMGREKTISRTRIAFQYATIYYQYLIEHSKDGKTWEIFSDKRNNVQSGSPMTDYNEVRARYLKLTITGIGKQGFPLAVWDFKAFEGFKEDPEQLLIHLESNDLKEEKDHHWLNMRGMYGGKLNINPEKISTGQTGTNLWVMSNEPLKFRKVPLKTNPGMDYTAIATILTKSHEIVYAALYWDPNKKEFSPEIISGSKLSSQLSKDLRKSLIALLQKGELNFQLKLLSIKVFNRQLHVSEIEHYGLLPYAKPNPASVKPQGLLVNIDAEDLDLGMQVKSPKNNGILVGDFKANDRAPVVKFIGGRKAIIFDNKQALVSDFPTAASLSGNNPFTIEAWVLNPEIAPNECVFEWAPRGGQVLTSGQLHYGSNPDMGAVVHQGWPDMGFKGGVPDADKWHHLVVSFDGYEEKVYVDGKLNTKEQKMLFVKNGGKMIIGNSGDFQAPFSGAIASLKVYDRALSEGEIEQSFNENTSGKDVLMYLSPSELRFGTFINWKNQAMSGGFLKSLKGKNVIKIVEERLALSTTNSSKFAWEGLSEESLNNDYHVVIEAYVEGVWHQYILSKKGNRFATFKDGIEGEDSGLFDNFGFRKISRLNEINLSGSMVFSSLIVRKGFVDDEKAKELYRSSGLNFMTRSELGFETAPYPMNSIAAFMEAETLPDVASVEYLFVRDGASNSTSEWQSSSQFIDHELKPDKTYLYRYFVRDVFGNIIGRSSDFKVKTDGATYKELFHAFDRNSDLLESGPVGFDGMLPGKDNGCTELKVINGRLRLASKNTGFYTGIKKGAFVYHEVEGDFVAETEVADYSGLSEKKGVAYNEGSLVVVLPSSVENDNWELVSLSFFPLYDQGNMVTNQHKGSRPQHSNMLGWQAHKFLQIERKGDLIFLRTSPDGVIWENMPRSPVQRKDFSNSKLYVGLSQVTHSDNEAFIEFSNFRLSKLKK